MHLGPDTPCSIPSSASDAGSHSQTSKVPGGAFPEVRRIFLEAESLAGFPTLTRTRRQSVREKFTHCEKFTLKNFTPGIVRWL